MHCVVISQQTWDSSQILCVFSIRTDRSGLIPKIQPSREWEWERERARESGLISRSLPTLLRILHMHLPHYTNAGEHQKYAIRKMRDVAYAANHLLRANVIKYYQTRQTGTWFNVRYNSGSQAELRDDTLQPETVLFEYWPWNLGVILSVSPYRRPNLNSAGSALSSTAPDECWNIVCKVCAVFESECEARSHTLSSIK